MITEETIARVKSSLQATKSFSALEVIEELEKENAELKEKHESNKRALKLIVKKGVKLERENAELKKQIEKMKNCANCKHCDCKTKEEVKICGKCTFDKELWSQWELEE